jgi:hypothetical protein
MLAWLKRRARNEQSGASISTTSERSEPQASGIAQAYLALHKYLTDRYANVVVLTFAQMEDLLDSPLPAPARRDPGWWNSDDVNNVAHTNSWRLARRTAVANLVAQTVTFERA